MPAEFYTVELTIKSPGPATSRGVEDAVMDALKEFDTTALDGLQITAISTSRQI